MKTAKGAHFWYGLGFFLFAISAPLWTGGFQGEFIRDEKFYWDAAQYFSKEPFPTLDLVRTVEAPQTPLLLIAWSYLERGLGGGPAAGRWLNWLATLAMLFMISYPPSATRAKAALGVLFCPYFIFTGVLFYTDPVPNLLGLITLWLHERKRYTAAAFTAALAISCRQFLLVIPSALLAYELLSSKLKLTEKPARWIAPFAACLTMVAWFIIFEGHFGPGPARHFMNAENRGLPFFPKFALYGLSCIGLYYFVFEFLLWREGRTIRIKRNDAAIAAGLAVLFALFPPLKQDVFEPKMGALDIAGHALAPGDFLRMVFFWLLATFAAVRLLDRPRGVPFWLILIHIMLLAAQMITWDKYALPVLVALWYYRARNEDFKPRPATDYAPAAEARE